MPTRGKVIRLSFITKQMVRDNPNTIYVFGDNMLRAGLGGQAKEMRGEPNTIGIPTKWAPSNEEKSFFSDSDWMNREVKKRINTALNLIAFHLEEGQDIVIPLDGVGTGLAQLPTRAPAIHKYINDFLANLGDYYS